MANSPEHPALMEPMLPPIGKHHLEDMAVTLVEKNARMASQIHPTVQIKIGDLIRAMNCYYSNLIEGHNTHPRDIERALADDFSHNKEKRDLQMEAKAHIEVQALIDNNNLQSEVFAENTIKWLHKEFYARLPESLRVVTNHDNNKKIEVIPGKLRDGDVVIGRHIPPRAENLHIFLKRFEEAYNFSSLSRTNKIIAVAAAHHRLLWIHPFYDGNGRVARLLSHAGLKQAGAGNSLWSISRGLARNAQQYKQKLDMADSPRQGDYDGRGSLSQKHLVEFCEFFLEIAVDQTDFMMKLLDITKLLERIEAFAEAQIKSKLLPKGSTHVLKELIIKGSVERGAISTLTGYSDRQSRSIVAALIKNGLIGSDTPYGELYIHFPQQAVEAYFPQLYPPTLPA